MISSFRKSAVFAAALAASALALPAAAQQQTAPPNPTTPALGTATLNNAEGQAIGTVAFVETPNGVLIQARINPGSGLASGMHGFHIHENGTCEPPNFQSAGGHFNPTNHEHGVLSPRGPHAGDLPNIWVAADGAAQLEPDLVKPFKQAPCPRQPTCNRYLAWFITQRNRFRPKAAHKDSR